MYVQQLLSFCIGRDVVKYSLLIPLLLKGISLTHYIPNTKDTFRLINWIGIHSFEIYLAQSICMAACVKQNIYFTIFAMTIGILIASTPFIFISSYIKHLKL